MKELFVDISSVFFEKIFLWVGSFSGRFVRRDLVGKCLIEKTQFLGICFLSADFL